MIERVLKENLCSCSSWWVNRVMSRGGWKPNRNARYGRKSVYTWRCPIHPSSHVCWYFSGSLFPPWPSRYTWEQAGWSESSIFYLDSIATSFFLALHHPSKRPFSQLPGHPVALHHLTLLEIVVDVGVGGDLGLRGRTWVWFRKRVAQSLRFIG